MCDFFFDATTIKSMQFRLRILCLFVFRGACSVAWGPSHGSRAADDEDRFWSFQPVRAAASPEVHAREWARSPVDAFILAKLEERKLTPSPAADRRTLIRRAALDLTGLPPTPEEIEAFLADNSPQAFAPVVDRLSAPPRSGGRWGRRCTFGGAGGARGWRVGLRARRG